MAKEKSFRFRDDRLNREFLTLLRKRGVKHRVARDGVIHYAADDEDVVDNDVICQIRDGVFPEWQVLTCPRDWIPRYTDYMQDHGIPFSEELSDGELWFLLPRRHRPHAWKLRGPKGTHRMAI